jgi:site-specific DNA-methyltransferase (adenine-specific)
MGKIEFNKIYNMDCLEGINLIPDNSIDLVITDPSFAIDFKVKKWE